MEYPFTYYSDYLDCEVECFIDCKLSTGPVYDSPHGPLGESVTVDETKVIALFTVYGVDILSKYKLDMVFQKEIDREVQGQASQIVDYYQGAAAPV